MEWKSCVAAALLLVATWIPWGLSRIEPQPSAGCDDRSRLAAPTTEGRQRLAVALCPSVCAPPRCSDEGLRGAARLLLGRPLALGRADASELEALPGIGSGMARKIARAQPRSLEELERVPGLGRKRARALAGWVEAGTGPPEE